MSLWNPPGFQPVFFTMESLHLARAYYVAAELGIADLLAERPRDIADLAAATGTDPTSLFRMLRALAAFGVFAQDRQGRFCMTRRARVLLSDSPGSLRSWVRLMGRPEIWQGHARTLEAVKTGTAPFELAHGEPFYQYLAGHRETREAFFAGLGCWTEWQSREIVKAYDFGRFATIMDVGGGTGSLLSHILLANPKGRGILFDRPETLRLAEQRFAAAGLGDRCRAVAGTFFDALPRGADACIIKNTLCDCSDENAARLLSNCHTAMEPGGTLLVIDAVVDPRSGRDRIVKLLDLEISSLLPGGMRTAAELVALAERCGFGQIKVHPTAAVDIQIIEAVTTTETVAAAEARVNREAEPARLKVAVPLPVVPAVPAPARSAVTAG
jgi:SAM-dependent methyltransferase